MFCLSLSCHHLQLSLPLQSLGFPLLLRSFPNPVKLSAAYLVDLKIIALSPDQWDSDSRNSFLFARNGKASSAQ